MKLFNYNEKIYDAINLDENIFLTKNSFTNGVYNLFFGTSENLTSLLFSILNFGQKQYIIIEDTKLFFVNLHCLNHSIKTEDSLYEIINYFFNNKKELSYKQFIKIFENVNKDN